MIFNDGSFGNSGTFNLSGNGFLTLNNSAVTSGSGDESLVNDFYHTIQGTGTISNFAGFTNIGTLQASNSGGTLLVDKTANLTNWDGAGTLTNGAYIAK